MLSHSSCGRNAVHVLTRSPQRVGAEVETRFMASPYPRDMVGYGAHPPHPKWPGEARVAVQFVLNYEEGSENCILHGDLASESFLSEIVGSQPYAGLRHMNMESLYEYGSRAGFWRLHRLFTTRAIPVTVYGVAMALERNPAAVGAMLSAGWEIASHGYRWIDYQFVAEEVEREHLHKALDIHTRVTGSRPLGWYTGRCSPIPVSSSWRRADFSTTPIAMPTICPIGWLITVSRTWSFRIRWTPTTCDSPPTRGLIAAINSSPT